MLEDKNNDPATQDVLDNLHEDSCRVAEKIHKNAIPLDKEVHDGETKESLESVINRKNPAVKNSYDAQEPKLKNDEVSTSHRVPVGKFTEDLLRQENMAKSGADLMPQ